MNCLPVDLVGGAAINCSANASSSTIGSGVRSRTRANSFWTVNTGSVVADARARMLSPDSRREATTSERSSRGNRSQLGIERAGCSPGESGRTPAQSPTAATIAARISESSTAVYRSVCGDRGVPKQHLDGA